MPEIPIEFLLFALTLVGVALFHHKTFEVAVTGVIVITLYKLLFSQFGEAGAGFAGLAGHLRHEWVTIANLGGLLLGFAVLSAHFEHSRVPKVLPRFLPSDWRGPLMLLIMVFVLSSFLDNIAAAMIGGAMAHSLFPKVHIGYTAGIVAAANAGGSGSVVGDTTTTMMWIDGVAPIEVLHAYVAAGVALFVCGIPAAFQQQASAKMVRPDASRVAIDSMRVLIVVSILATAIAVNVVVNVKFSELSDRLPFLAMGVWAAILATAALRQPDWDAFRSSIKGTIFLLCLVLSASMMPVEKLPSPSWITALILGFVSAVFDNIPLTALALEQGGYDWGMLAYSVGFGGSMIWFGSSAGVAISNLFPDARSVGDWLRHGWHVAVAYVIGFFVLLAVWGWQPGDTRRHSVRPPSGAAPHATELPQRPSTP
jgi:Na+/H+ antiporter NhaD/arsenite permease-like protein